MITIRKASERGRTHTDWLDSRHTFAFGDYFDERFMGFRGLRVLNDDRVAPGMGFGMHPHSDMEILTWVLSGALQHRDSLGSGSVIRPGDLQRMTAGTGIYHSEFNPSNTEPVRFLQVWILPNKKGLRPSYDQREFPLDQRRGKLLHIAGPNGQDGAVGINAPADVYASSLEKGERVVHALQSGHGAWVQVASGEVQLNGMSLTGGDGVAVVDESAVQVTASEASEVLLFDMA